MKAIGFTKNPVWLIRGTGGTVGAGQDFRITILDPRDPIAAGVYLNATPYRVRAGTGRKVLLVEFAMQLKTGGALLTVDVEVSADNGDTWATIFNAPPEITGKSGLSTDFAVAELEEDNLLRYNVLTAAGSGFEGILRGKVI